MTSRKQLDLLNPTWEKTEILLAVYMIKCSGEQLRGNLDYWRGHDQDSENKLEYFNLQQTFYYRNEKQGNSRIR
jgi:hypothetical protein